MKKLLNLLPAISLAVAMLASHPAAAAAFITFSSSAQE